MVESAKLIKLHASDNVVIVPNGAEAGEGLSEGIVAQSDIPAGHKVAVFEIPSGGAVLKYNQAIGLATQAISPGAHVHDHNVTLDGLASPVEGGVKSRVFVEPLTQFKQATFLGYDRNNGRYGTRNYIGIVTSVNCSATAADYVAKHFTKEVLANFPNVDGVVAFTHGSGCGMARHGYGFDNLTRVLSGYLQHPNFGGVLMFGLGCEANQIGLMFENTNIEEGPLLRAMTLQDEGGTIATVNRGIEMINEMLPVVNSVEREPIDAKHLTLALQCGGSDAYSGITANPALGVASDILVQHGGSVILAETPEIVGAENLLIERATNQGVVDKLVDRIKWWQHYTAINDAEFNNNPSPGNKAGGLSTIFEKSLGAVAKSGSSPLVDVLLYGERLRERGLNFMDSPGFDPVSITGEVASGANLVAFTTGRGSCYGCKPVPSVKLATNSTMYARMEPDMDVNCGRVVDQELSVNELGQQIFDQLLRIASGEPTKSEALGVGDNEFVPWQIGAIM
ncbi:UxaA family hydrolase [Ruegeria hyattellae]|uniref:UxaA family hydrolase n=1 Tax=Ruegeria hyattellae TaxID=3233337 RepID=UPI00355C8B0F